MGYIFIAIFVTLAALFGLYASSRMRQSSESGMQRASGIVRYVAIGVLTAGNLVIAVWSSYYQVPAGSVGVVYQFGAITGQRSEGLQWVTPWQDLQIGSIQVQKHHFPKLTTFSKQSQDVFIAATINIRVSPENVQKLYREVGPNYFEVLVVPRVQQFLKDETVRYDTVDVAPSREQIRNGVRQRLNEALGSDSIEVVDFLLDNVDFLPEFKTAIEKKQIASQQALEEEQKVAGVKYQADQVRARAEGEADARLINAKKEAEANNVLTKSITPELVQYLTVQKLAPNVSVMMIPAGNQFILGSDLISAAKPK